MQRKAIVIVPSEEDFKARTEAQEKAECKDVPDNAVMEMKGIKTSESKQKIEKIGPNKPRDIRQKVPLKK